MSMCELKGNTWTESRSLPNRFGFFGLETSIQFQIVNVTVKLFGGFCNFSVGVPFQETSVCCTTPH